MTNERVRHVTKGFLNTLLITEDRCFTLCFRGLVVSPQRPGVKKRCHQAAAVAVDSSSGLEQVGDLEILIATRSGQTDGREEQGLSYSNSSIRSHQQLLSLP